MTCQCRLRGEVTGKCASKNCPATQGMMTILDDLYDAVCNVAFEELPRNAGDDDSVEAIWTLRTFCPSKNCPATQGMMTSIPARLSC